LGIENLLCFGEHADGKILATKKAFHAWVEVGGWLIDFMAPEFPDVMKAKGVTSFIPSKMWQMELNKASSDIDSMKNAGDFFLLRDNQLIDTITQKLDAGSFMKLLDECSFLYGTKNNKASGFDQSLDGYW